jgi:iron complex transport system permease protein
MRRVSIYLSGFALLLFLFWLSLDIGILQLHSSIISLIGKHGVDATTVWQVRFPRALGAVIIGAGLGIAGAIAQGIFRNPLAEPTLIGLSSGATLGTIALISSGASIYGTRTNIASAVLAAAITALLVQWVAPGKGFGFLLTGIAISAVLTSIAGLLISISPKPGIQSLTFWDFGSLTLLNNSTVSMIAPYLEVGIIICFMISRRLDIYSLGESSSHYMGVNPVRLRLYAIIGLAFLIGASVSAVGTIAFIGLLVPHIVRLLIGPAHRKMLSLSALIGAIVLLLADLLARTLLQPNEIPLGLLTSLLGAPALIILLRVKRASWINHD